MYLNSHTYPIGNQQVVSTHEAFILPNDWVDAPLGKADLSDMVKPPSDWLSYCSEKWLPTLTANANDELATMALICDAIFNREGLV